ncbi:hypothetical protein Y032_0187g1107 [Ancylostoma ceylanicum]|uniref:Uncharacterized protein n=1 Tax=Ancylostoma ceylanicum TaxID=53326 RepID=A0A016SQL6_9BILA|nr:hypothetical protein Y032_0187g1107 [Ancylostoma ceylanicum]
MEASAKTPERLNHVQLVTGACMGDIRNVKNKCALNYAYFVAPIGEAARREEAGRRVRKAIETIDMHFQTSLRED